MPQQAYYYPTQAYYYPTGSGNTWYSPTVTTCSTQVVWQDWVANTGSAATTIYVPNNTYATTPIWQSWVSNQTGYCYTPSAAVREANERYEAERRQRRQEADVARVRARVLLGEFLTEEQKAELEHHGRFHVTGSAGRRYCIRASGQSGNVDLLGARGDVQATLCAHPGSYLPDGDAWLMQMIEIRHNEDHFLRTANVHRGSLPPDLRRLLAA